MKTYRVRYQTIEIGGLDVHLRTLRDLGQYADDEGAAARAGIHHTTWPLFGVVWPSSQVLAHFMLDFDVRGLRILEVGCGLALASLVLGMRQADITATDHHPEVESFLEANSKLNGLETIPYHRCDWRDVEDQMGLFDVIVGSDLLYQSEHPELLSGFIHRHAGPRCQVILAAPGRREQPRFDRCMLDLGYLHAKCIPTADSSLDEPFRGRIHRYARPPL